MLVVPTLTDPNETLVTDTLATAGRGVAENATVLEAERTARAVKTARRITAFRLAGRQARVGKPY